MRAAAFRFWVAFAAKCSSNGLTAEMDKIAGEGWQLTAAELDAMMEAGEIGYHEPTPVVVARVMKRQLEKIGTVMGMSPTDATRLGELGIAKMIEREDG